MMGRLLDLFASMMQFFGFATWEEM